MYLSDKTKNDKFRDLLCYAAQFLLDNNYIRSDEGNGFVTTDLCGKQSVIKWRCQGFQEVEITVWWGYKGDSISEDSPIIPLVRPIGKVVDATASGILERKCGLWIMGSTLDNLRRSLCRCATRSYEDLRQVPTYHGSIGKTGKVL